MLTGDIRNQIDRIWDAFWSGGIANPVEVIEQITYLLFLKRLDEVQTAEELKAAQTGKPLGRTIFPEGVDSKGLAYEQYRWQRFKNADAGEMFRRMSEHVVSVPALYWRGLYLCALHAGRALHCPHRCVAGQGGGPD